MRYSTGIPHHTCSLGVLFNFRGDDDCGARDNTLVHSGGTPYFIAGFINTDKCREAYEWLCNKAELVYQTPVYKNKNSNRLVFSCLFKSLDDRYGFDAVDKYYGNA